MVTMMIIEQSQSLCCATVSQELITSKQKCIEILQTKTSSDSDESLRYSGWLFQTDGPEHELHRVETIKLQTRATSGCMAAGQSP